MSKKFVLLIILFSSSTTNLLNFMFIFNPVYALNIGLQSPRPSLALSAECSKKCISELQVFGPSLFLGFGDDCSRKCESEFCTVPPFLKYGKYCGILYSGCPGETPCDGLDACCMKHDDCVGARGYLSRTCTQELINCMNDFKKSRAPAQTFMGNKCNVSQVIDVITAVMNAALVVGKPVP